MSVMSQRLRECRKKASLTQMKVAIYADITERAYANYESGVRMPKLDILIRIADVYKVSLDYLTGRTDDPTQGYLP